MVDMLFITNLLNIARAGGGGSGGDDGGGEIFVVIGYLPPMFIGRWLIKRIPKIVALPIIVVISIIWAFIWFSIGGIFVIAGVLALVGGADGYFGWSDFLGKRIMKARKKVKEAAAKDGAWDEQRILTHAQNTFTQFQDDWGKFNVANMQSYMTTSYFNHMQLMMFAIQKKGRQNYMVNLKIKEVNLIEISDADDNSQDWFSVHFTAQAEDHLFDKRLEKDIFTDNSEFQEEWRFQRNGDTWLLAGITQSTENPYMFQAQLQAFATQNGMFYSPDMGWLLMPLEGDLFGEARFGKSDLNNHVIGVYNGVLTEVYTYQPVVKDSKHYIVAQAIVPKTYGKLVVKRKSSGLLSGITERTPKGLNKITLEWPDFNKRYNVYADNVEQVTAFELLHPVFMEKLFALDIEVNIEVADNIVYLYTSANQSQDVALYQKMFTVLLDAYKEMRL